MFKNAKRYKPALNHHTWISQ